MFLENLNNIIKLAERNDFSIFITKETEIVKKAFPKNRTLFIAPEDNKIGIDKIREIIEFCHSKQSQMFYIVILAAEKLNEQAENALLKILEEPAKNYHFILQVADSSALLPTILSRATIYTERIRNTLSAPLKIDETQKIYARRIISAKPTELLKLVQDITAEKKFKKDPRGYALSIVETAIEISYKSFFKTRNSSFLKKLPTLITLQDNLKRNGHIKLHLVADLC